MQRRDFLQETGLYLVGGSRLVANKDGAAAKQTDEPRSNKESSRKRILITSAESRVAQMLAAALNVEYRVRLTGKTRVRTDEEFKQSALGHDTSTGELVRGIDAIVHVAELSAEEANERWIDDLTRGTYNLLWAAAEERVRRV